jgi:hypothetical protein
LLGLRLLFELTNCHIAVTPLLFIKGLGASGLKGPEPIYQSINQSINQSNNQHHCFAQVDKNCRITCPGWGRNILLGG